MTGFAVQGGAPVAVKVAAASSSLPAAGEDKNGDRAVIREDGGVHLLAVIDGLGHGPGADEVSCKAQEFLLGVDLAQPLHQIMEEVHRSIAGTRGAAATICILRGETIEACAVGNVELRTGTIDLPLVASPGVLGARVAKFRICEAKIRKAGRIFIFSDGISSRTRFDEMKSLSPKQCCDLVVREHRRDYDDSTILVADVELDQ